jgi:hypothetical protein
MAAFDPATLDRWRALAIVDRDGGTVGTISEFYLDRETGHPTWALVNTGLFGATRTFVPLVHATEISDGLQVPYEKNHIKDAPRVDPHDELTPDEEATLFGHYGVEYQPSTEPTPPEPGLADPTEPVAQPNPGDPAGAGSDPGNPPDAVGAGSDPGNPPDTTGAGSTLGHRPAAIEADRPSSDSSEQTTGDPTLATTGPGPVPATAEAARTAGVAPQPSTERSTRDPVDPMTGRLDDQRPGTELPAFDESVWPPTSRATTGDERPAPVDADPARTTDAADRPPRPPEEAGWAPGEPGGFEEQEPADHPTGASDLRLHEADADQETTSTPPEDRSPLERARRRLERLVSGGQADNDPSPADRDAPERARRQRFGLNEPDDHGS